MAITESYKRPEVETITGDQFKKDTEKKEKQKEAPIIEDHRKEVVTNHEESEVKEENTSLDGSLVVENKDSAPKKDARSYYKK